MKKIEQIDYIMVSTEKIANLIAETLENSGFVVEKKGSEKDMISILVYEKCQ